MSEPAKRPRAEVFDGKLRYLVPSRHDGSANPYLVELDSYNGNGRCVCKYFVCRLEPLLKRAITPEFAVAQKMVKLKDGRAVEDALRCEHVLTARSQFCDNVIKAIHDSTT